MNKIAAFLVALFALAIPATAAEFQYQPPRAHYCVDIGQPPGILDASQLPTGPNDTTWPIRRYRTAGNEENPGAMRGAEGWHTSDYGADLETLGYRADEVSRRDAYCARDEEIVIGARAVRIAGDMGTPFEPGFWSWGRKSWNTEQWRAFAQYNERALRINLGDFDADLFLSVIARQIELAEHECATGKGITIAADPAVGAWAMNKAGKCAPTSWSRKGEDRLYWARPVSIEVPSKEFAPSRLSTGRLWADLR